MTNAKNLSSFQTPAELRKLAKRVARIVKNAGSTYEQWRSMNKIVRKLAKLVPGRRSRRLPHVLSTDELARFWKAVDAGKSHMHGLMLRVMFTTGCRVSELVAMQVKDVDLAACSIRINQGKGRKDRIVLFPEALKLPLLGYLDGRTEGLLWIGRQGPLTARRVGQIVAGYAKQTGVKASPHTFRHQALTQLTRAGMADAEIQLLSGHSRRDTLAIYQHLALPDVAEKYQKAMR